MWSLVLASLAILARLSTAVPTLQSIHISNAIRHAESVVLQHNWFESLEAYTIPTTSAYPESHYRILPFAFQGSASSETHPEVSELASVATQCTVDSAHEIAVMAQRWRSRISAGIFALKGVGLTHQLLNRLRQCSEDVEKYVDFHIVFVDGPDIFQDFKASEDPVKERGYVHIVADAEHSFKDVPCTDILKRGFATVVNVTVKFDDKGVPYPINMMRNVPRWYLRTPHVFMFDCDLAPSPGLIDEYERVIDAYKKTHPKQDMAKVGFVVPAFEINITHEIPMTKKEVFNLWHKQEIWMFYWRGWGPSHGPSNYGEWLNLDHDKDDNLWYDVDYNQYYEPYFGAQNDTLPPHDARFLQYGYDRVQEVRHAHEAGEIFVVMRRGFVVHPGIKWPYAGYHPKKDYEANLNRILYQQFEEELAQMYPKNKKG